MSDIVKKLKIIGSKVFFKPDARQEAGGIIIPDNADEAPEKGRVCGIGNKVKDLKIRDHILFQRHNAQTVRINDEEFWMILENKIYAILPTERIKDMQAIGDYLFINWEFAQPTYAGTNLVRPGSYDRMHYTGTILSAGPAVGKDYKVGVRVFFDQFCNPGKFQEGDNRFAFIHDYDVIALLPARSVVTVS